MILFDINIPLEIACCLARAWWRKPIAATPCAVTLRRGRSSFSQSPCQELRRQRPKWNVACLGQLWLDAPRPVVPAQLVLQFGMLHWWSSLLLNFARLGHGFGYFAHLRWRRTSTTCWLLTEDIPIWMMAIRASATKPSNVVVVQVAKFCKRCDRTLRLIEPMFIQFSTHFVYSVALVLNFAQCPFKNNLGPSCDMLLLYIASPCRASCPALAVVLPARVAG